MRWRSGGCFDVDHLIDEKESLSEQTYDPHFWNDPERAKVVNTRIEVIKKIIEPFQEVESATSDLLEIIEMTDAADVSLLEADQQSQELEGRLRSLEVRQMLAGEQDKLAAIVSINAGSGGTEAQDWAQILQRMFLRFAQQKEFEVELVDEQAGDTAGIKSATFICRGDHPYGYLKSERGVHRLVRISPFDSAKRRHTSFAAVDITPEIDEDIEVEIKTEDLRVDTYRSSGAGGQHVNKTDSAIRLTHLPTGIVVACQSQRSQHQNRATAMKMLKSKLYDIELAKKQAEVDAQNAQKMENAWGSQIRSYILAPYRLVKDHRTNYESSQVQAILDGDLENFVEAYLLSKSI